jgi:phosphoribosylanthranilate isomerase
MALSRIGLTRVKICGLMQAEDALVAGQAGADFVGLIFVPERRRRIDIDRAQCIVSTIRENLDPPPTIVGLFADQTIEEVDSTVQECGLDMVQLCGTESVEYCGQLAAPVIKVLHVQDSWSLEEAVATLSEGVEALGDGGHLVTLDRMVDGLQGGTGQSFNWQIARELSNKGYRFLLAGGLDPENVADAVAAAHPWGVDVSTGVETDGDKDPSKVRSFIAAARCAAGC